MGDALNVMVLDVDLEKERISLGLKQTMENPWEEIESRYPTGARVHGKVVNLAPHTHNLLLRMAVPSSVGLESTTDVSPFLQIEQIILKVFINGKR